MPKVIISGRGGSGKSTLVTLLAGTLAGDRDVLVIDADESNLGLPAMLGMEPPEKGIMESLGGKPAVGQKLMKSIQSQGEEKVSLFEEEMPVGGLPADVASVSGRIRLARIGKIDHPMEGCACPMGATARAFLNALTTGEAEWVIVDTEAGIEHMGRGVLEGADMVLMLVDPSHEAVLLADKAGDLAKEAGKEFGVVISKADDELRQVLEARLLERSLEVLGAVPTSEEIAGANLNGEPLDGRSLEADLRSVVAAIEEKVSALR